MLRLYIPLQAEVNVQATKKILQKSGNSNDRGQNDEVEFPANDVVVKLNMLATARLSELLNKATPAEQAAVKALIGDVTTSTVV